VSIQSIAAINQSRVNFSAIHGHSRTHDFKRLGYLLHNFPRGQVGPVQNDRQVSEANLFQSVFDYVQSGLLLGNK
jgi:hypothetical protein